MKKVFLAALLLLTILWFSDCKKKTDTCKITATITKTGTPCSQWGIQIGNIYPSRNIPNEFKQEGLQVCVEYELYEDMALCPCCGGTWANIKSIALPAD